MNLAIEEHVSLAPLTTLRVGGPARWLVRVRSVEELRAALRSARSASAAPPLFLGGGSNLLISDQGYDGFVIKNEIAGRSYKNEGDLVVCEYGAGEEWDDVARETCERGWWGFENLSAIPGTVGAAPIQNVGAYGVEVASLIRTVTAVHAGSGKLRTFSAAECGFGYRDSYFKTKAGRSWCITSVMFALSREPRPQLSYGDLTKLQDESALTPIRVREAVCAIRSGKFPDWSVVGTAGSFFKNPIVPRSIAGRLQAQYPRLPLFLVDDHYAKLPLGWVLDHICGLRGVCRDGVCLYEQQALVLVNKSATSATAIDDFATWVADQVQERTGIIIEREVRTVGGVAAE